MPFYCGTSLAFHILLVDAWMLITHFKTFLIHVLGGRLLSENNYRGPHKKIDMRASTCADLS